MPALSMFFGIIIYMYREQGGQHNIPHIHAEYQDDEAVLSLDGDLIEGTLPKKKLRMVQAWIDITMMNYKPTGSFYHVVKLCLRLHHCNKGR